MWGGIGAGKSSAADLVFAELGISRAHPPIAFVGVDDLIELIPEYRAAVDAGGEAKKDAYMKYRGGAKELRGPVMELAMAQKQNICVEWTQQRNLQKFSRGEDWEDIPSNIVTGRSYDVVLALVSCKDIEGILQNAAKRERTIPEPTIIKYNRDRTKHFVEAADKLYKRYSSNFRAFVVERKSANAEGVLKEVTQALPLVKVAAGSPVPSVEAAGGTSVEPSSGEEERSVNEDTAWNLLVKHIHIAVNGTFLD